nr:hypothetical protein [Tanacetum cinerariifolium]
NWAVCKTRTFALADKPHTFFAPEGKPPWRGLNPRPLACDNNLQHDKHYQHSDSGVAHHVRASPSKSYSTTYQQTLVKQGLLEDPSHQTLAAQCFPEFFRKLDTYNHSTPISTNLSIINTRKLEQWKFRIQRYLQHEYYALWKVIEFGDSYKAPPEETAKDKGLPGEVSSLTKKKRKTVAITVEDMQKRKNDVKPRTTLLLALPDEHQLRFSKYYSAKELWEAILKTFGGNEATKKIKKNQLKQQYGNFNAEGSEKLKQNFNRPIPSIDISKSVSKEQEERWKSNNPFFFEPGGSCGNVVSKPMIKFVKESGCPNATKVNNTKNARKPTVKYAGIYKNTSQSLRVRGNQRNWNNQKSQQLGKDFMMQNKACYNCGIPQDNIDDKGYWNSGCSKHMTGNISYLSEYEPFNWRICVIWSWKRKDYWELCKWVKQGSSGEYVSELSSWVR